MTATNTNGQFGGADDRAALDGFLFVLQTGIPWEVLPKGDVGFVEGAIQGGTLASGQHSSALPYRIGDQLGGLMCITSGQWLPI